MLTRIFTVLLILYCVVAGENGGSAVGFSSPPVLVSEKETELPLPVLIKRMVDGTVSTDLSIDRSGTVTQCRIAASVDPLLDSLVCEAMTQSRFSPAYSDGQAVPSTVTMDFTFDLKAVIGNSAGAPPEICGILIEKTTGIPVANAKVNLQLPDTIAGASEISDVNLYMTLIAQLPDQNYSNGILSTTTDSTGSFAFRLLPAGGVRCAFIKKGYEIAHAELEVREGVSKKITCMMEPLRQDTVYELVVYGKPVHQGRMEIEEEMVNSGMTHYLSDLLQVKTVIRNIPDSRTMFMVRGGSPFDNRYYISGIPFLSPYHFGGVPALEIDGLMINSLNEINVTLDDICGRQLDASGFRLDANPGIYRKVNRKKIGRPELSIDYSTIGQDFQLSFPRKESSGLYQLGFTHSEDHTIKFINAWKNYYGNEKLWPSSYGNGTFTFSDSINGMNINSFSWLAMDIFGVNKQEIKPWGMAHIALQPGGGWIKELSAGGSYQYFSTENNFGIQRSVNYSDLKNVMVSAAFDTFSVRVADISGAVNVEGARWEGQGDYYEWSMERREFDRIDSVSQAGEEVTCNTRWSLSRTIGSVTTGANILAAAVRYEDKTDLIGDAGIYTKWQGSVLSAGMYCGRVSSRPDIRGLPENSYRSTSISSWLMALPINYDNGRSLYMGMQPYLRWKTHEPYLDPVFLRWNRRAATALVVSGNDIDMRVQPLSWLALDGSVNLMYSRRYEGKRYGIYEWDIPWTTRSGIHIWGGTGSTMHLYLNCFYSKGMYYYNLPEKKYQRLPDFFKTDLSVQYRSKIYDSRFLTRYDAYVKFMNVIDYINTVGYTWDQNMEAYPTGGNRAFVELGARLGFRL